MRPMPIQPILKSLISNSFCLSHGPAMKSSPRQRHSSDSDFDFLGLDAERASRFGLTVRLAEALRTFVSNDSGFQYHGAHAGIYSTQFASAANINRECGVEVDACEV